LLYLNLLSTRLKAGRGYHVGCPGPQIPVLTPSAILERLEHHLHFSGNWPHRKQPLVPEVPIHELFPVTRNIRDYTVLVYHRIISSYWLARSEVSEQASHGQVHFSSTSCNRPTLQYQNATACAQKITGSIYPWRGNARGNSMYIFLYYPSVLQCIWEGVVEYWLQTPI